jgi:hypothetical protein
MPFVPFLSSLLADSSFGRLSRRFGMKMLGFRWEFEAMLGNVHPSLWTEIS